MSQRFWPHLNSIIESDQPLFEKIEAFCAAYIDKVIQNPYLPLFVIYEMNQRPAQFIKKMFQGNIPNPAKLMEQIDQEVKAGNINPVHPAHLMMNLISMCIFPFMGKPMMLPR